MIFIGRLQPQHRLRLVQRALGRRILAVGALSEDVSTEVSVVTVDAKRLRNLALIPVVAGFKSAFSSSSIPFTMLGAPRVLEACLTFLLFWLVRFYAGRAMFVHSTQHLQSCVVTSTALLARRIALL